MLPDRAEFLSIVSAPGGVIVEASSSVSFSILEKEVLLLGMEGADRDTQESAEPL